MMYIRYVFTYSVQLYRVLLEFKFVCPSGFLDGLHGPSVPKSSDSFTT